jgi:hypothetical protein
VDHASRRGPSDGNRKGKEESMYRLLCTRSRLSVLRLLAKAQKTDSQAVCVHSQANAPGRPLS